MTYLQVMTITAGFLVFSVYLTVWAVFLAAMFRFLFRWIHKTNSPSQN